MGTTMTNRTKTCQGLNLAVNETCFEGGSSVGTCASGLICLEGKCKATGTCADPVFPNSLCYSGDVNRKVADCCSGSYCIQQAGNTDSFCMSFSIGDGDHDHSHHRGLCHQWITMLDGTWL